MVREHFPFFEKNPEMVYVDSAATALKPSCVLDAMRSYDEAISANVHRGVSSLSQQATTAFEDARTTIAQSLGVDFEEVVFTKNCTEALNLAAHLLSFQLEKGDEILILRSEHHSSILPWQELAHRLDLQLTVVDALGALSASTLLEASSEKTKVVVFAHMSNVLGILQPLDELTTLAKEKGWFTVVDGAQGVVHDLRSVRAVDCYAFSGHKLYGPTGIGVLTASKELLEAASPFIIGGGMIHKVAFEQTTFADLPWKFEAGTPPIAQAIGLARAVQFVLEHKDVLDRRVHELSEWFSKELAAREDVVVLGEGSHQGVFSFFVRGAHSSDIATLMNASGIQLREGHHCAQPLLEKEGISGLVRCSFLAYTTKQELEKVLSALDKAIRMVKV